MTLVIGTAGHIDHGKTTLLRALTGIDADRLPEERRRGMTIDVGFAHLALHDGTTIDFVDVPGHDRLVGNMLVGAGEIDAALLVVAADDGPRAQTLEHLALLDALGVAPGIVVVTKIDAVAAERVAEVGAAVAARLEGTSLAGSPILVASGTTGEGLPAVLDALAAMAAGHVPPARPPSLALDRVFTVKGRGVVVTGTLRGGPLARGDRLRLVPGEQEVRIREIQVHGGPVERVAGGGRTAANLVGVDIDRLRRGLVLSADPEVQATDRLLAAFTIPAPDRARGRLHTGTAAADAAIGRGGRDALMLPDGRAAGIVRLVEAVAFRPGDRFVLRRGGASAPIGGVVLDLDPPRGHSRRRQTGERVGALAGGGPPARLDLHGALPLPSGGAALAPDVEVAVTDALRTMLGDGGGAMPLTTVRAQVSGALRRLVTLRRDAATTAASALVDRLVADGRLVRDGDTVRLPGAAAATAATPLDPIVADAMDRLEAALAVVAPPPLTEARRAAGCPPEAVLGLERAGRIVVLEPDLAYAMTTYRDLAGTALRLAAQAPLTPATLRDATGTSRKYVMAILEDLDRRAILRRTAAGHVPGPKAPAAARAAVSR